MMNAYDGRVHVFGTAVVLFFLLPFPSSSLYCCLQANCGWLASSTANRRSVMFVAAIWLLMAIFHFQSFLLIRSVRSLLLNGSKEARRAARNGEQKQRHTVCGRKGSERQPQTQHTLIGHLTGYGGCLPACLAARHRLLHVKGKPNGGGGGGNRVSRRSSGRPTKGALADGWPSLSLPYHITNPSIYCKRLPRPRQTSLFFFGSARRQSIPSFELLSKTTVNSHFYHKRQNAAKRPCFVHSFGWPTAAAKAAAKLQHFLCATAPLSFLFWWWRMRLLGHRIGLISVCQAAIDSLPGSSQSGDLSISN
jgi:hypothetical protein